MKLKSCEKSIFICVINFLVFLILYLNSNIFGRRCEPIPQPECSQSKVDDDKVSISISEVMSGEPVQLPQNDERVIKYIWENNLLEPPSGDGYNVDKPEENPSKGQAQFIQRILGNMTGGFFVEAGALDGETRSNSLFLEMHLGWKGLLVEGAPSNYALVRKKNRKSWISNTCLAIKPYPHKAEFMESFNVGKILTSGGAPANKEVVTVQCMPLFSLLSALNVTTVDYFSLDVEGSELKVLKTIPFDKILIKTLSVEFIHTNEGKDSLLNYMVSQGYDKIGEVRASRGMANDYIFAHKSVSLSQ